MARTRSIKPGFFDNDVLGDLPALTRLLFIGLWCIADREGRLEDRPKKIKKALLGYDDVTTDGCSEMLQQLHNTGFIIRYEVSGERYIQIVNFGKHQNPHMKEKASEISPPSKECFISARQRAHDDVGSCDEDAELDIPEDPDEDGTGEAPGKTDNSTEQAGPITGTLSPSPDHWNPTPDAHARAEPESNNDPPSKDQSFELFWAAYPKKVGKKEAKRAWKNAKVTPALFERIMQAVGRARTSEQWTREKGRYIPNPSTWLNQGRWDDELEVMEDGVNRSDTTGISTGQQAAGKKASPIAGFKRADVLDE